MSEEKTQEKSSYTGIALKFGGLVVGTGLLGLAAMRFKIAKPNEILIKTGLGVRTPSGISLHSSTVQWPFQNINEISIAPVTISTNVVGMTEERIPLKIPFVATVGPKLPNENNPDFSCLTNYARRISLKEPKEVEHMITSILAGESRIITAGMTIDTVFNDRAKLKSNLADEINKILEQFGLDLINLNIEELDDDEDSGSNYFFQQRQKALAKVETEAKIAVATATREGLIGQKDEERQSRIRVAELEALARKEELTRQREVAKSESDYLVAKADYDQLSAIAKYTSEANSEKLNLELQKSVEVMRASQELERLRAGEYSSKVVAAEILVRETEGNASSQKIDAENLAQIQIIKANAQATAYKVDADAKLYLKQKEAEGNLALSVAEADGKEAVLMAEANGLRQKVDAAGGPQNYILQDIVQKGTLPEIAREQASAVRGMNPNIQIWSQGSGQDGAAAGTKVITNLIRDLPPMLDSLKHQTGIDLPELFNSRFNGKPQ